MLTLLSILLAFNFTLSSEQIGDKIQNVPMPTNKNPKILTSIFKKLVIKKSAKVKESNENSSKREGKKLWKKRITGLLKRKKNSIKERGKLTEKAGEEEEEEEEADIGIRGENDDELRQRRRQIEEEIEEVQSIMTMQNVKVDEMIAKTNLDVDNRGKLRTMKGTRETMRGLEEEKTEWEKRVKREVERLEQEYREKVGTKIEEFERMKEVVWEKLGERRKAIVQECHGEMEQNERDYGERVSQIKAEYAGARKWEWKGKGKGSSSSSVPGEHGTFEHFREEYERQKGEINGIFEELKTRYKGMSGAEKVAFKRMFEERIQWKIEADEQVSDSAESSKTEKEDDRRRRLVAKRSQSDSQAHFLALMEGASPSRLTNTHFSINLNRSRSADANLLEHEEGKLMRMVGRVMDRLRRSKSDGEEGRHSMTPLTMSSNQSLQSDDQNLLLLETSLSLPPEFTFSPFEEKADFGNSQSDKGVKSKGKKQPLFALYDSEKLFENENSSAVKMSILEYLDLEGTKLSEGIARAEDREKWALQDLNIELIKLRKIAEEQDKFEGMRQRLEELMAQKKRIEEQLELMAEDGGGQLADGHPQQQSAEGRQSDATEYLSC